jgi:hypothetical protein
VSKLAAPEPFREIDVGSVDLTCAPSKVELKWSLTLE